MRTASVELLSITLAFALGCASSNDGPGGSDRGGSSAMGGSAPSLGGTVGQSGAGTVNGGTGSGGLPSGGSPAGSASSNSGGSSGLSSGGVGGRANGGAGGKANGGAGGKANGGAGGKANGGAGGRASGGSGSGDAGACVQNLACKLSAPPATGDIHQDCVDRINQFLTQCACLPALTRRTDGEACADQMAEYDAGKNMAHAGFKDKICSTSGSQNECPGYSSNSQVIGLCMQQMWDEGPPPTDPCNGSCYEMYGHFINMTDKTVTKVACGFYTTSAGKVWAVQNFSH